MNNISCPVVKHNFGQEMSRDWEDASPRQSADVYFRARSLKTGSNFQPAIIALEILSQKRGSLSGGGIGLDEGGQSPGKRKCLGLSSCGFAGIPGAAVCCALKDRGFQAVGEPGHGTCECAASHLELLPLLAGTDHPGLPLVCYSQAFHPGLYFPLRTWGVIFRSTNESLFLLPSAARARSSTLRTAAHGPVRICNGTARTEASLPRAEPLGSCSHTQCSCLEASPLLFLTRSSAPKKHCSLWARFAKKAQRSECF